MFSSFINKAVYHVAFATGYSCHTSAKYLRVAADKLDVAGDKCGGVAVKHGLACGVITQEQIDNARAKLNK